jgi:hypothetical protein
VRRIIVFLCSLSLAAVASSCVHGGGGTPTDSIPSPLPPSSIAVSTPPPTPPALPATPPPRFGPASATCEGGWSTPAQGSSLWLTPLAVIRKATGVAGRLRVVDMRTFVGPESPPSRMNYLSDIRRWYVKLFAKDDLSFQGRFLVEDRRFGRGLAAVAPYDTHGFVAPDWVGFQYDAEHQKAFSYRGLPGTWTGIAYDFVNGGRGLTLPGLPTASAGCLDGT